MSYQEELDELTWAIDGNEGQFALILARCNKNTLQAKVSNELQEIYGEDLVIIKLDPSLTKVYTAIQNEVKERAVKGVIVCGLEENENPDKVFTGANQIREEFRKNCPFPIIWWLTDEILPKIKRLAPDLESWTTTVEFSIDNQDLINYSQEITDQVFQKILQKGATRYLDQTFIGLGINPSSIKELKSAYYELQQRKINISTFLLASIEFVLTLNNQLSETEILLAYEKNLKIWQQLIKNLDLDNEQKQDVIKRKGCVAYYLGVWWRTYAIHHRVYYEPACEISKDYLTKCLELFEQIKDSDLVAKFINSLGDILERTQDWEKLEVTGKKAVSLHQKYLNPFRLARAYSFLAQAYLAQESWENAYKYAKQCVDISLQTAPDSLILNQTPTKIRKLEWVRSFNQGAYFFVLAKAELGLNLIADSLKHLEKAKLNTPAIYEPELYIKIIEYLQEIYYNKGDYLKAFELKQEKLSVEQQFGFRAFIGAGRLKPNQTLLESDILPENTKGKVAQEIEASGRQLDIERLVERIARSDHKLTIIYGPSGVGKSSIIQAGLIPALQEKPIKTRDIYPVLIQVYTEWKQELGQKLKQTFNQGQESYKNLSLSTTNNILEYLKNQVEKSVVVVLIFDQFEEFFFVNNEIKNHQEFYTFFAQCIEIPYLNIIFSLREDYIHYLLELNRLENLKIINNNILDKNIIYYFGNFSKENSKNIINTLTEKANLLLESSLIDQLVEDLSMEGGEVRPIELQIIGAQLQADKITTFSQYKEQGTKNKLVQKYLEEVIADCGEENKQLASLILYLLTEENNTRPFQTYSEITKDLQLFSNEVKYSKERLELVLEILVKSGLVCSIPDISSTRYQLVHDYIARFIRQQQEAQFIQKIEQARQAQANSENKLNLTLKWALGLATLLILTLSYQYYIARQNRIIAQHQELEALVNSSTALFASDQKFSALIEGIKAGEKLKIITNNKQNKDELYNQVVTVLQEAIFWVKESNSIDAHDGIINDITLSKDGKMIVSVSDDKTIKIWQSNGTLIRTINDPNSFLEDHHNAPILAVEISPDQKFIVSASSDQTLKIWSINGQLINTLKGHKQKVNQVAISPNGKIIASASDDGTVKLWTFEGKLIKTLFSDKDNVKDVKFSPNGKIIVSVGNDGNVKLWTLEGKLTRTIQQNKTLNPLDNTKTLNIATNTHLFNSRFNSVDFSPDGQKIVTGSLNHNIAIWTIEGKLIQTIEDDLGGVNDLKFSPDGTTIASAGVDKTIKIWALDGTLLNTLSGHNSQVINIEFASDGKTLISAGADHKIKMWQHNQELVQILRGDKNMITDFSFATKPQILATISQNEPIKIWSTEGQIIQTIPISSDQGEVESLSLDPSATYLILGYYSGKISIWKKNNSGKLEFQNNFIAHQGEIHKILWSPNGKMIASTGVDKIIKLWDIQGNLINQIGGEEEYPQDILNLAFSPDSNTLISSTDSIIKLWNIDGSLQNILKGHQGVIKDLKFSPDGEKIISASHDNTIKIWSKNGEILNTLSGFQGHQDIVSAVTFNNQGNLIASASNDNTIKLWTIDGKLITTLRGHNSGINYLVFNDEKSQLISVTDDNRIILWNLKNIGDLDQLLTLGCDWLKDYLLSNKFQLCQ